MPFSCSKLTSGKVWHFICSKPRQKNERQKPQTFHVCIKLPQCLILAVLHFIINQMDTTETSFAEINSFVCHESKEIIYLKFTLTLKKYLLQEKEQTVPPCILYLDFWVLLGTVSIFLQLGSFYRWYVIGVVFLIYKMYSSSYTNRECFFL